MTCLHQSVPRLGKISGNQGIRPNPATEFLSNHASDFFSLACCSSEMALSRILCRQTHLALLWRRKTYCMAKHGEDRSRMMSIKSRMSSHLSESFARVALCSHTLSGLGSLTKSERLLSISPRCHVRFQITIVHQVANSTQVLDSRLISSGSRLTGPREGDRVR